MIMQNAQPPVQCLVELSAARTLRLELISSPPISDSFLYFLLLTIAICGIRWFYRYPQP